MSKKHESGTIRIENTAKTHVPDGVLEALNPKPKTPAFEVGQIIKASKDGEVCVIGPIADIAEGQITFGDIVSPLGRFPVANCQALTDDERARFDAVSAQSTLGMGNIIDAVVNGGA